MIDVKNPENCAIKGQITIRMSYMPPTFASIDRTRDAQNKNQNERFAVMKDYNGFIFSRMGRIIDVVTRSDLTTFQNNDRYIKIEIDFPAVLDEEFNVTTSKQQIVPSERMWDLLRQNGLLKALEQLRKRRDEEKAKHRHDSDQSKTKKRPSETAMERAAELMPKPAPETVERKRALGQKGFEQEAERRSRRVWQARRGDPEGTRIRTARADVQGRHREHAGRPIFPHRHVRRHEDAFPQHRSPVLQRRAFRAQQLAGSSQRP